MVANLPKQEELDWIKLRTELDDEVFDTPWARGMRKCRANPFVPIGCLATASALTYGIWNFSRGDKKMSQYMMRTRVVAQGATIIAILFSLNMAASKE